MVDWKTVSVSIEEFEPLQRRLVLADVDIDGSSVTVVRDRQGSLNWLRFMQQSVDASGGASPVIDSRTAPTAPPAAFAFTLKHAAVRGSRIKYMDEFVGRFEQEVVNLQAEASGLTTARPEQASVKLSADIKDNGSFSIDGNVGIAPLAGRMKYAARDVRLVAAARYLANVLNGTLDGTSDVDGMLEVAQTDAGLQLTLRDIELAGKNIKLRGPADSGATLDIAAVKLSGGALDLTGRSITIEKLALDAPRVAVRRLRDGSVNWQELVREKPVEGEAPTLRDTACKVGLPHEGGRGCAWRHRHRGHRDRACRQAACVRAGRKREELGR